MAHRLYLEIRTEAEVVAIAREFALTEFGSQAVMTFTRLADGCWESALSGTEQERFPAFSDVLREYCSADASE